MRVDNVKLDDLSCTPKTHTNRANRSGVTLTGAPSVFFLNYLTNK